MSNRENQEREAELQPKRMEYAIKKLTELGIKLHFQDETTIRFFWKDSMVSFYPYSGWHSGKTIIDGRGIEKLLKQLK
jgi:hypothetical protein